MRPRAAVVVTLAVALSAVLVSTAAVADEGGARVWLPGQFARFAAVPGDPGFPLEALFYFRRDLLGRPRR
jgi:hypothetical protein